MLLAQRHKFCHKSSTLHARLGWACFFNVWKHSLQDDIQLRMSGWCLCCWVCEQWQWGVQKCNSPRWLPGCLWVCFRRFQGARMQRTGQDSLLRDRCSPCIWKIIVWNDAMATKGLGASLIFYVLYPQLGKPGDLANYCTLGSFLIFCNPSRERQGDLSNYSVVHCKRTR